MLPSKGTARAPCLIGKSVGCYKVMEWVGSGTCAAVYTALEKGNPRNKVAIKCVEKDKLSKYAVENIIVEIRLLKKLHHPHILDMKDFLWDDQFIYIITEYCSGGDLGAILKSKRGLREPLARRYLQQIAYALKYLRENDVSHMDLKPHNLLLSTVSKSMVKIGDFGLAQHLPEEERKTSLRGSPLYMAPEILFGKPYDAKVDLWSAGVILYEMVYGSAPYSSSTIDGMLEKVRLNHPINFPKVSARGERLSQDCLDLLPRLLERDPKKRIDFPEFFVHPFVDLAGAVGPDSLEKAKSIALEAVSLDTAGKADEAAERYFLCVQHLQTAMMYESDEKVLRVIRERIRGYERRHEALSRQRSAANRPSGAGNRDSDVRLMDLVRSTPRLEAGVSIGLDAESYERGGQYEEALEAFENALGTLVPVLKTEPKGERRELISKKIHEWLSRAEKLKLLLAGEKPEIKESSDDDKSPVPETASHLTWGEMIAKDMAAKEETTEIGLGSDNEPALFDVSSPDFDPLSVLRSGESSPVPVPDVRVFDNVKAYQAYVQRGGKEFSTAEEEEEAKKKRALQAERARKNAVVKGEKVSRDVEVQVATTGKRAREFRNILSTMDKIRASGGPVSRLAHFMESSVRVKVRTRNYGEIRGECTGFLEMFDKYWNLVLRDVDEVYQRLVTTTDGVYDLDSESVLLGDVQDVDERPNTVHSEQTSKGTGGSHVRSRHRENASVPRREVRKERFYEPSEGLYAKIVEEMGNLSLQSSGTKKEKLPDYIPPAILVFKKVKGSIGKRAIFRRHVPMMMIRGENVVTVSCCERE